MRPSGPGFTSSQDPGFLTSASGTWETALANPPESLPTPPHCHPEERSDEGSAVAPPESKAAILPSRATIRPERHETVYPLVINQIRCCKSWIAGCPGSRLWDLGNHKSKPALPHCRQFPPSGAQWKHRSGDTQPSPPPKAQKTGRSSSTIHLLCDVYKQPV
jgi:hypothetical protein